MNQNLTPIEKLDTVLNILELNKYQSLLEITKGFDKQDFPNTLYEEIQEILNYLIDEGYVSKKEYAPNYKNNTATSTYYRLTFKGFIFKDRNGYLGLKMRSNAENIRLDNLEKRQKRYESNQTWLLALVAVGTLVAAWYYLIEIAKFYCW